MLIRRISIETPTCNFDYISDEKNHITKYGFLLLDEEQIILFKNVLEFIFNNPFTENSTILNSTKVSIIFEHGFVMNMMPKNFGKRWRKKHYLTFETDENGYVMSEDYSYSKISRFKKIKRIIHLLERQNNTCSVFNGESFEFESNNKLYYSVNFLTRKKLKNWKKIFSFFTINDYEKLRTFRTSNLSGDIAGTGELLAYFWEHEILNYNMHLNSKSYRFLKNIYTYRFKRELYVLEFPDFLPEEFLKEWTVRSEKFCFAQFLWFKKTKIE